MNKLAEHLQLLGLNYSQAAALCGVAPSTVHRHIHGKRGREGKIPAESAIKYARGLDIPLYELRPDLAPPPTTPPESNRQGQV